MRAMVVVTAAITAERLAPVGGRVARAIGAVVISVALFWIARTARYYLANLAGFRVHP